MTGPIKLPMPEIYVDDYGQDRFNTVEATLYTDHETLVLESGTNRIRLQGQQLTALLNALKDHYCTAREETLAWNYERLVCERW